MISLFTLCRFTTGSRRLSHRTAAFTLTLISMGAGTSRAVEIIKDNTDASGITVTGTWTASTAVSGYQGTNYLHDGNAGKGSKSVRYTPTIATAGQYLVYGRWTGASDRAAAVPFTVTHAAGTSTVYADQRVNAGAWYVLGTYTFAAGTAGSVLISNTGTTGNVIADAVRFVSVDPPPETIVDNTDASGVTVTGSWTSGTTSTGYYGSNYWSDGNTDKGTKSVRFTPTLPAAGNYRVFVNYVVSSSYSTSTPVTVTHALGSANVTLNQRLNGGRWNEIGTYRFNAGTGGSVLISNAGTTGYVIVDAVKFVPTQEVIVDNADSSGLTFTGAWTTSVSSPGYYGSNYTHDNNGGKGSRSILFTPDLPAAGNYDVLTRWVAGGNRADNAPIDVTHSGGTELMEVNQQEDGNRWMSLGVYPFNAGTGGSVLLSNTGTSGYVIADAVRFSPQLIVDNADAAGVVVSGTWTTAASPAGFYGTNYLHDGNAGKGSRSVRFTPSVASTDRYDVYVRWSAGADRAGNVPIYIASAGGTSLVRVDERYQDGEWVFLGNYLFHAGTSGNVLVSNAGTTGIVTADAIRLAPHAYTQNRVSVISPAYCSTVSGTTTIQVVAPGFTQLTAKCWQAGGTYGSDTTVASLDLDSSGNGVFNFPAASYPYGPIVLRITGTAGTKTDTCYFQLYNTAGAVWNQGIPAGVPAPATAAGLSLLYADDFNTMPTISSSGAGATYSAHKPGGGDFSGIPFSDPVGTSNPFSQVDSYLRIRADANKNTTGLISSLRGDGTGFLAACPAYFECRFIAPSGTGTWPAFWLLSYNGSSFGGAVDELDIIEAYGGEEPVDPKTPRKFSITSHNWGQTGIPAAQKIGKTVDMSLVAGGSGWMYTPHVYGCLVTATDTVYYLDQVEVGRHQTSPVSKTDPFWFMINLAVGGLSGWQKDLSRYDGLADMYIDYVRVYGVP